MKAKPKKPKHFPTLTVDKKNCKITPAGKVHASGKKNRGYVIFNALKHCTILFTNHAVLGRQFLTLRTGHNKRLTPIDKGHTPVMIAGCASKIPRSLGAAALSNPNDIIVP